MAVIKGTKALKKSRQRIVVEKTGHPASFRKMRCPKCSLGYAVMSEENGAWKCDRCGHAFMTQAM
jgi:ribosomal protein L37AE/L43A